MLKKLALCIAIALLGAAGALQAQQPPTPPIKRTILQKSDIPGTNLEVVLGLAEIAANASVGRHTHQGPEEGTVTEGELVFMIEGQPDRLIKAGDSYQVPAGVVHDAKAGSAPAKVIAAYVVPKGQPLATPAK